ncbi:MAG: hypothetical protein KA313_03885 [Pseudarcicella sp.]|nr:hypothetical protein [Pseudarcicella sp.]MBP6410216.1 hypothetical protein [Pseudarcicella sp.]
MTKELFSYLVANPTDISKDDLQKLEAFAKEYPYCQITQSLIAKGYTKWYPKELTNEKIKIAAIYSNNRNELRKYLNEDYKTKHIAPKRFYAKNFGGNVATQKVSKVNQLDIINEFIEKKPGLIRPKDII